jgi:hypothetical protein
MSIVVFTFEWFNKFRVEYLYYFYLTVCACNLIVSLHTGLYFISITAVYEYIGNNIFLQCHFYMIVMQ